MFVDLTPIRDPDFVVSAIAYALGVRDAGDLPIGTMLKSAMRERHLLLVLDNLEQVVVAAPDLADLLAACPDVKALTTSRVRLRLEGSGCFPSSRFQRPPSASRPRSGRPGANPAIALFVENARAADPGFALTAENAAAVAAVCTRLDGLPLALELAAARADLFDPSQLLARLERRLPLLVEGARDAPARQRTMRDAIAWSYDLLTPEVRALFRRLAVFVGGFTLERAEAVTGGEPAIDAMEGVAALAEQSLVRRVDAGGGGADPGPARFGMLETVREFGLDELTASGEEEVVRQAHAAYFVDSPNGPPPICTARLLTLAGAIGDRAPQPAGSHELARGKGRVGRLPAFLWPTPLLLVHPGPLQRGSRWLERSLTIPSSGQSDARARALVGLGLLLVFRGDANGAEAPLTEGLALAEAIDDPWETALAFMALSLVGTYRRDSDWGEEYGQEALVRYRALATTDPRGQVWVVGLLHNLGVTAYAREDLALAEERLEEALAGERAVGVNWFEGLTL